MDDDGVEVVFDEPDALALLALLGDLDDATVSACPDCRARVLAAVALVDLLERSRRTRAPASSAISPTTRRRCTSSSSIGTSRCRHKRWRDPLADEWRDVVGVRAGRRRGADDQPASASSAANAVREVDHQAVDVLDGGRVDVDADVERIARTRASSR